MILYVPEGAVIYANDNTYSFHRNSSYYNDILENGMEEQYLRIIEDDTECLDCSIEEEEEEDLTVITTEAEVIEEEKPDVSIQINEEDGVNIEVNDN